jgi:hypothetical protein
MKFDVCQEWFVLLSCVYVMKVDVYQDWFMLLSKQGTNTQITPDIPQTSLHKHVTAQNTPETPQTSLHKHGQ